MTTDSHGDSHGPIAVYGASGHGLAIAMVLQGQSQFPVARQVVAFIDDTPSKAGTQLAGIPVLPFERWTDRLAHMPCFASPGSGKVRKILVSRILEAGGYFECVYSNAAATGPVPEIGVGSIVAAYVYIGPNVNIGNHVQVMPMTSLGHDIIVGDYATICPGCTVSGYVHIEDGAFLGAGTTVTNGKPARPLVIGRDSIVGAGSVVTKSVAPGTTVSGNPARSLRDLAGRSRRAADAGR